MTSWLLICRLKGLAGFEKNPGLKSLEHYSKYVLFLRDVLLDFVDFISFGGLRMTILAPFGGPWAPFWNHFAMKWVTDALRGTLEGPRVDFQWFLMDFGFPFGDHFGSLFDIFCHLKCRKACLDCRHDYCWLLSWKYADFWCPHLSIYMVNTDVFIRFHFFGFFMNLMISGPCLDFILDT